ncbi:MAG TPA: lamin tail domain-containing protein [Nocardioides sp.]|nr:lamin tail domain-containing protein [Nocardioides sp.]
MPLRARAALSVALTVLSTVLVGALGAGPAEAATSLPCQTSGAWRQGELNVYWFDVEQGDSQLVVGPTGRTLLVDLGEDVYNSKGAATNASAVAAQIRNICGTGTTPVALDYVMASHHHLDHIGYAKVPADTQAYGNGLYQLLLPTDLGGLGFTVGQVLDRDGGTWTDANGNGRCDVGTAATPEPEVDWSNAGTTSQTARRFICWLYGPAGQADRAAIDGKVVRLTNAMAWPTLDLGAGATAKVVMANAKGVLQADGSTPVSGDHTTASVPPSENDYSVGLRIAFGGYAYATAGDSDGEYATSTYGYTYNDVEAKLSAAIGDVETVRANHHGSGHSSSQAYLDALTPQTGVISCGVNSYGHPANRTLDAFRSVGADIFLTNNPCDTTDGTGPIDYSGTLNGDGTIHLATSGGGTGYTVDYDTGSESYVTGSGGGGGAGDATAVRVNEVLMAPTTGNEWVELYNPTATTVDVGGYYVDDVAGGGGSPKQIPAGTTIPAGGRWVLEVASGFLNNTGAESVRFVSGTGPSEVEHDAFSWSLGSTRSDMVFHRVGDGGAWCTTISGAVSKGTANPSTCP